MLNKLILYFFLFCCVSCQSFKHLPDTATPFYKTELYLGMEIPDQDRFVSDTSFQTFLDEVVTPRFLSGFTVVESYGQWLHESGKVHQEPTRILIVFYQEPLPAHTKIEEIRELYKQRFQQQSVIRLDQRVYLDF